MHLTLIKNPDESKIILYKIARVVYAETGSSSLLAVESLVSMVANVCIMTKREFSEIIEDKNIFESLREDSLRHNNLLVDCNNRDFKMCLRVVQRMFNGNLLDICNGATRFHHVDVLPDWAKSIGYVAEVDGLLFYM